MNIPTIQELLEAGAHFGHQDSRWHPKMGPFIFGARGGVHIIDLEKTQKQLETSLTALKDIAARGGLVLFVGTKAQSKKYVKAAAQACDMPFVTERWLGGTLTNFTQIRATVKRIMKLRDQRDKDELGNRTKLERLMVDREIEEYEQKVGGIEKLVKMPDAIFIADIRNDKTALTEASVRGVKIFGVCDTNVNPTKVDHVIPMNDDAVRSIELVTTLASDAVKEGRANPIAQPKPPAKKPVAKKPFVRRPPVANKPAPKPKAAPAATPAPAKAEAAPASAAEATPQPKAETPAKAE